MLLISNLGMFLGGALEKLGDEGEKLGDEDVDEFETFGDGGPVEVLHGESFCSCSLGEGVLLIVGVCGLEEFSKFRKALCNLENLNKNLRCI